MTTTAGQHPQALGLTLPEVAPPRGNFQVFVLSGSTAVGVGTLPMGFAVAIEAMIEFQ